jgi:hypothetical protein
MGLVAARILLLILADLRWAAAYTDPGSGLALWHVITASLVGISFQFRKWFWQWVRKMRKTDRT